MELNFDCLDCDELLKKERGCNEKGIVPFINDGEFLWRCPLKLITDVSWEYIKAYNLYEKGFLPNGNGWLQESNRLLDALSIINRQIQKLWQEKNKRKK